MNPTERGEHFSITVFIHEHIKQTKAEKRKENYTSFSMYAHVYVTKYKILCYKRKNILMFI